jgi:uncharacterized protein (DUF983 family)
MRLRALRRQAHKSEADSIGFAWRLAVALARTARGCVLRGARCGCGRMLRGKLEYRDKCFVQNAMRIERTVRTVEA